MYCANSTQCSTVISNKNCFATVIVGKKQLRNKNNHLCYRWIYQVSDLATQTKLPYYISHKELFNETFWLLYNYFSVNFGYQKYTDICHVKGQGWRSFVKNGNLCCFVVVVAFRSWQSSSLLSARTQDPTWAIRCNRHKS